MSLPKAVNYQFMIMPGAFANTGHLEVALKEFFESHDLEARWGDQLRGQGETPIMWIMPKKDDMPVVKTRNEPSR